MPKVIHELPVVLTSFGYRPEYVEEMEGMLISIKEHHPNWLFVIGRGPLAGFDLPTLEVESPAGKCSWSLPVPFNFDDTENDFLKIVMMKAWWIAQVWHSFAHLAEANRNRMIWTDADARFNGKLDIELDPEGETLAAPWWHDVEKRGFDHICTGLMLFQGARRGPIEKILDEWSARCLGFIKKMPPQIKPWPCDEQEVLTEMLQGLPGSDFCSLELDSDKYIGLPTHGGKEIIGRGLVDHWFMSAKMRLPEHRGRNWPPPEEYRRRAPVGTPIPNKNWNIPEEEPAR